MSLYENIDLMTMIIFEISNYVNPNKKKITTYGTMKFPKKPLYKVYPFICNSMVGTTSMKGFSPHSSYAREELDRLITLQTCLENFSIQTAIQILYP